MRILSEFNQKVKMKQCYIITGSSSGIGEALSSFLLNNPNNTVIGISRNQTIHHNRYHHFSVDLSNQMYIQNDFIEIQLKPLIEKITPPSLVLVNNAGIVDPIGYIGTLKSENILSSIFVNSIAPFILTNSLVANALENKTKLTVLNIGTGASSRAIDGWSAYCSTKAALQMQTKVWDLESSIKDWPIKFLEFVPGVIDTPMQENIRNASLEQFSKKDNFVAFKDNNQLEAVETTIQKIMELLEKS